MSSLDLAPLDVMSRLRRAALALAEARHGVFKEVGLGDGEFEVLAAVGCIDPQGVSPTRLLSLVNCDIATLKRRIARLGARGMINRECAPGSARGVLITLTPSGRARVDTAMTRLIVREREMLATLSVNDVAGLERGLRKILEGVDRSSLDGLGHKLARVPARRRTGFPEESMPAAPVCRSSA